VKKHHYGTDIDKKNTVYVNKMLEKRFKRELLWYCHVLSLVDIEYKTALLQFCNLRNIEIDVDITLDNLQKMDYRNRKKEEEAEGEKFSKNPRCLSVLVPEFQQGSFFENYNDVRFKHIKVIL
jgi:hypothetical protein